MPHSEGKVTPHVQNPQNGKRWSKLIVCVCGGGETIPLTTVQPQLHLLSSDTNATHPPPRRFATARIPPSCWIYKRRETLKTGMIEMLKPP